MQQFAKYRFKLGFEAFLKSLLCGLSVGLIANFITSLVTWFTGGQLWITLTVFGSVSAIATAFFFLKVFRPTVNKNARRLDKLGLEERLVSMVEYESDESYIASVQREDARKALSAVDSRNIRIRIAKKIWIPLIVCFVLGASMTTVSTLAEKGFISGGDEIVDMLIPKEPEVFISVTYDVEEGGSIDGEADQLVLLGQDATAVTAIPDEGYAFVQWSDGSTKPYRVDRKLEADIEVFAIFEEAGEGDGDGDGDGAGEGEGDGDGDGQGEGEGEGKGNGNGQGEGQDNDGNGTAGGGKYEHSNQIIDGKTYYREVLDEYRDQMADYLEENRDKLSAEQIAVIEQYLGIV
jgi:hypothetical protein